MKVAYSSSRPRSRCITLSCRCSSCGTPLPRCVQSESPAAIASSSAASPTFECPTATRTPRRTISRMNSGDPRNSGARVTRRTFSP
ncbi:MAG: hypothetical protein ACK55Z_15965, partial [bacterium]